MPGIVSYGAYVPIYRLSHSELARAWGGRGGRGEVAVANYDEDSITMAVEAAIDCLDDMDRSTVDALYFASTTSPYREKQSASIIAAAVDLGTEVFTMDTGDSLRAGTGAIKTACDAVKGGSAKNVLVTVSDCRLPAPNSEFEPVFGDGAAAFLIGDENVAVEIEGSLTMSSDFIDVWKRDEDTYLRTWEDRFILDHGYREKLAAVIQEVMKKHNLTAKDFAKLVYYGPDARSHGRLTKALGFDTATQVQDPMFDRLGNTGAAFATMMLVAALEEAKPGDRILLASYGDGAEALILRVTDHIDRRCGEIAARYFPCTAGGAATVATSSCRYRGCAPIASQRTTTTR